MLLKVKSKQNKIKNIYFLSFNKKNLLSKNIIFKKINAITETIRSEIKDPDTKDIGIRQIK